MEARDRGRDLPHHELLDAQPRRAGPPAPGDSANHAIFPPEDVNARLELIHDIGEATVPYDRLWTEVKTAR